jgi:outer membrane lipoprotein-sorting protein
LILAGDITMRRLIAIGAIGALGAFVLAQVSGSDMLNSFAKSLNGAKSMSATLTVQQIGGSSTTYKVDLAKPNKARVETPTQLVVADGNTITTYDKGDNSYFKKPETQADLQALFAPDELSLFGAFFDADFYKSVVSSKPAGQKVRKGVSYDVVLANMDNKGKKTVNFYLDPKDKLAKVGEFVLQDAGKTDTVIVAAKDYAIDGNQAGATYAFSAPEGSKEISLEEMNAGKWYENLEEAKAMAKKLNKPILVDFYADW